MSVANPTTQMFEFQSETIGTQQQLSSEAGTRGTLEEPDYRVREEQRFISGSVELQPTPIELDKLIPLFTGATKVNDATAMVPTDPLPAFTVQVDRGTAKVYTYTGCKAETVTISATAGSPMKFQMDIKGQDVAQTNAGTFPALSPDTGSPFILADLALTIGGTTYPCNSFSMTYKNELELYYANSVTPTRINQVSRSVMWDLELPAGDAIAIWGASAASAVAVQATFTNGNTFLKLRSELVRAAKQDPTIGSVQGEVPLNWSGESRINATFTSIIYITNDSSP